MEFKISLLNWGDFLKLIHYGLGGLPSIYCYSIFAPNGNSTNMSILFLRTTNKNDLYIESYDRFSYSIVFLILTKKRDPSPYFQQHVIIFFLISYYRSSSELMFNHISLNLSLNKNYFNIFIYQLLRKHSEFKSRSRLAAFIVIIKF